MKLTIEEIRTLIDYNPDTGKFTRISSSCNGKYKAGSEVKGSSSHRYSRLQVNGESFQLHDLAIMIKTGSMPDGVVDHINGNSKDNSWSNLRVVDIATNNKNKAIDTRNKSGVSGVHWYEKTKSWKAQINVNGKRIHLGYFKDLVDATLERLEAELEYGFHFNHGRDKV